MGSWPGVIRNERQSQVNTAVLFSSASDRWPTPQAVKDALYAEFALNFDPCPLDGIVNGLAPLFCQWYGKRVFCNPPYGPGITAWLERGFEADIAVYLLPARTDTRWFHTLCLPHAEEIRFLRGRLRFGNAENTAPFPSMIVVFRTGGYI
jgi:DNA N-6-adenine-methyltransferase (Dam)